MAMSAVAGRIALGALPKAAIPAGKLKTPEPTILFTKLNISLGMDAVPPGGKSKNSRCAVVAAADILRGPACLLGSSCCGDGLNGEMDRVGNGAAMRRCALNAYDVDKKAARMNLVNNILN